MNILVVSVFGSIMLSNFFAKAFSNFANVLTLGSYMDDKDFELMILEERKQLFKNKSDSIKNIETLAKNKIVGNIFTHSVDLDCKELWKKVSDKFLPDLVFWVDTNALTLTNLSYLKNKCKTSAFIFNTHTSSELRKKRLEFAKNFDFIFLAFKNDLDDFQKVNENVFWIPVGYDAQIYKKLDLEKIFDWCFIGQTNPKYHYDRVKTLKKLIKNTELKKYIGTSFLENSNYIFNQSKIVFNRSLNNDINMRVFEAMGSGSLLFTDELTEDTGLYELFENKKHFITYKNDDLIDLFDFYIKNEDLREKIAKEGLQEVFENHTYNKRVEKILKILEK